LEKLAFFQISLIVHLLLNIPTFLLFAGQKSWGKSSRKQNSTKGSWRFTWELFAPIYK